jgi:hypothetical protein
MDEDGGIWLRPISDQRAAAALGLGAVRPLKLIFRASHVPEQEPL